MSKRNRIGAAALAAALIFAPFTGAAQFTAGARAALQQDDVPSEVEQGIFNKGRDLFAKGQYDQAAAIFRDFLKSYPNSFIADLMLLWLGRSYIELGQIQEAEQVGQRLRSIRDSAFVDIYESELQTAREELARRGPVRQPARAETREAVARATPQPTSARTAPTPRPTPVEIAGNTTTPPLTRRVEGNEQRSSRIVGSRRGTSANNRSRQTNNTTPRTQQPPATGQAGTQVASNVTPVTRPTPSSSPVIERRDPVATSPITTNPPPVTSPTANDPEPRPGSFSLTVVQVPNLNLALRRAALAASPGQTIQLPLTVTNTGNKEDQFRLDTDLPAEYQPTFSLAQGGAGMDMPILVTPQLARGASLDVQLNIRIPDNVPDNQQQNFLVRAASQANTTIQRVADATLTVVAAALAAASNVGQETVMPGETFVQRISVRNLGSASARQARADFIFNPDFELVSAVPAPISYDRPSRTAIWSLGDLDSRDSREITVTLRAVQDALAANSKPVGRGTMRTQSLVIPSNFDGPSISVGRVSRAQVDAVSKGLTATPGDTIFVPFIVHNPSNYPEGYALQITAPGAPAATIYADVNGDGRYQENEPAITQTPPLDPRGGTYPVLLRVDVPRSTPDRQQYAYNLVTRALNATGRVASEDSTVLTVAAPRVRVRTELGSTQVKPGDTIFYRLVLVNEGGGLAKNLVVTELLPEALEFVSSDPSLSLQDAPGGSQRFVWRVADLAPGDTTVLRVTVRVRPNLPAGAEITPRRVLTYQDTNGNNLQGQ